MMRKGFLIAVFTVFSASVIPSTAEAKLSVFACEPEWKSLVEEIGGDSVEVYSATTGMQDPHHVEARPSLIAHARNADMMICTGADLEVGWLPVVQRRSGNARIQNDSEKVFFAAEFVDRLEIPESVDRSQGDVHAAGNPHVHLDPRRVLEIASRLTERLQAIDPTNAQGYANRWQSFEANWRAAMTNWAARVSSTRGTRVMTHHRAWSYLLDWLDWKSVGELEPLPGTPPTTRHLAQLIDSTARETPSLILVASYQDPRGAKWLSDRTDIPVVLLPSTIGGSADSRDLFSLFEEIVDRLTGALPGGTG